MTASALIMIELAGLHRATHAVQGMFAQQLQDPHEPPCAGLGAVVLFQLGTERGEAGRKLPVPEHGRVVEGSGLAAQGRKIVDRLEDQGAALRGLRTWVAITWPAATITTRST